MSITTILIKRNATSGTIPAAANMTQGELAINYDVNDGTVYYKDASGSIKAIRAGFTPSASYAVTASYASIAQNVLSTVTSASYAITASFVAGQVLSSSYAITSSLALQANNAATANAATSASYSSTSSLSAQAITASYAVTAAFALNAGAGGGGSSISSSWASQSLSSSYAQNAATASVVLGGIVPSSFVTFPLWDTGKAPTSPSAQDDEFNVAGTPDAKWINSFPTLLTGSVITNATVPFQNSIWLFKPATTTSPNCHATLTQLVPSGTWTVYTKLHAELWSIFQHYGLCVRDNATNGKIVTFGLNVNSSLAMKFGAYSYTNTGSFNANIVETINSINDKTIYLAIGWDGSQLSFGASLNGEQYTSYAVSSFITTPAQFGLTSWFTGSAASASFDYFRVVTGTSGTMPAVGGYRTVIDGGSLVATASYAQNASLLLGSIESASYAGTASVLIGSVQTASLANFATSALSASWASSSISSSYAATSSLLLGSVVSASYALTASFALNGGGGGGTSVPQWVLNDTRAIPSPTNSLDDEFDGASGSLISGWTAVNNTGTTASLDGRGRLILKIPIEGTGAQKRIYYKTPPATPYSFYSLVTLGQVFTNPAVGLVVYNSSTTKNIPFFLFLNANWSPAIGVFRQSTPAVNASTILNQATGLARWPLYMRIKNDGTTLSFQIGWTGETDEHFVTVATETLANFIGSVDGIGIVGQGTTFVCNGIYDFFRVTSP